MRSSHAILLLQDHIAEKGCSNISGGKSHGDISTKDTLTSTEKDDILLMASTLYTMLSTRFRIAWIRCGDE